MNERPAGPETTAESADRLRGTDGDRSTSRRPAVAKRRGVLAGIGLGGLAGAFGYGTLRDRLRPGGTDDTEDWETAADERIESHRTSTLEVVVVDEDDDPVPDAEVDVSMRAHAFPFGTAVNASHLVEETEDGGPYRTAITDLFNTAVLENHHKWGFWENSDERRRADAATEWLLARGLRMRGHTCIWQKRNQGAIPRDVLDAMDREDGDYVAQRASDHTWSIVDHYADVPELTAWDVLNEQVDMHEMTDVIEPQTPATRSEAVLEWFQKAHEADPDAHLYVNEYSILAGDDESHRDAFEELVAHLLESGAPLDGLGFQSHHWSVDRRRTPEQLLSTLDRFADRGPSIAITEYDTWGEEWTEETEAAYLYEFLKTVYSHPAVVGFVMWGFWDEIHWHDNAPLFRGDWSRKPAHDVYTDLVFDQWWTDETGTTNADGSYRTDAFLGEYDLVAEIDDRRSTASVSLEDPTDGRTVGIEL